MYKRLPTLRVPRSIRLLVAICILVIVLTAGAVYLPRLTLDSYRCLQYDTKTINYGTVIPNIVDIHTSSFTVDQRPKLGSRNQKTLAISPDGQYEVQYIAPLQGKPKLQLYKISGEVHIVDLDATNILSSIGNGGRPQIYWHPQSKWFTYMAQTLSGPRLAIVHPDGSQQWSAPLAKPNVQIDLYGTGISNDAAYMIYGQSGAYHFLNLSTLTETQVGPINTRNSFFTWSPQGHWIAIVDYQGHLLTLAPEDGAFQSFDIMAGIPSARLLWSPNGKYLALLLMGNSIDESKGVLNVYTRNEQKFTPISRIDVLAYTSTINESFYWISDSQSIVFAEPVSGTSQQYTLKQFWPDRNEIKLILNDISLHPVVNEPVTSQILGFELRSERDHKHNLYWLSFGTTDPIPIVSEAISISHLSWLNGKRKIAVAWVASKSFTEQHKLTIFDREQGAAIRTFDIEAKPLSGGVFDVVNNWVTYGVESESAFAIILLNTVTGQKRRLIEEMVVARTYVDVDTKRLMLEWKDKNDNRGIDIYTSDGVLLSRFPIVGTQILSFFVIRPDAGSIAIRNESRLEVVTLDSRWYRDIFNEVPGDRSLVWSPDSKYLAVATQISSLNSLSLQGIIEVFTPTGELVWQNTLPGIQFVNLAWTKCY